MVTGKRGTIRFNRKEIWLCDDSRLDVEDSEKWMASVKTFKWFGPFDHPDGDIFFSARPENGGLNSINLYLTQKEEEDRLEVSLYYRDFNNGSNSSYFMFR